MEKISIIIPLYNRQELIKDTLRSLIKQSYKNWEALVIDDMSNDNSFEIVKKIAEKEKRIKLIRRNRKPHKIHKKFQY